MNALNPDDRLKPLDAAALEGARVGSLAGAETLDLRPSLFTLALLLLAVDTLAGLWLGGFLRRGGLAESPARAPGDAGGRPACCCSPACRVNRRGPRSRRPTGRTGSNPALVTRLAYVVTGDAGLDEASRTGLTGLTQMLAARTALEPGEPAGIDPAKDELAFYPLIYWPIAPSRPQPSEAAIRRIDAFMRNGGTVLFDTRDALTARPGGPPSPEATICARCWRRWRCRNWNRFPSTTC